MLAAEKLSSQKMSKTIEDIGNLDFRDIRMTFLLFDKFCQKIRLIAITTYFEIEFLRKLRKIFEKKVEIKETFYFKVLFYSLSF